MKEREKEAQRSDATREFLDLKPLFCLFFWLDEEEEGEEEMLVSEVGCE